MNPSDIQIDDTIVSADVTFTWNKRRVKGWQQKLINGIGDMAFDMRIEALHRAPYVTGALRNSIRVLPLDAQDGADGFKVVAGGTSAPMDNKPHGGIAGVRFVDYAAKRERGPNRNPATEHYMENAQTTVMSGAWEQKYFGGITK